ncbi:MAG: AMP-binding protein, partial [Bacilli bacterium]|nr:AMP-binding protein [Bacilli bacterium]
MYPEYEKVQKFLDAAADLLKTNKQMSDVFESLKRNENCVAVEYINDRGKLKHYKYKKLIANAKAYGSIINQLTNGLEKGKPVVLKAANSPRWVESFWAILMAGYKPLLIDARTNKDNTINLINQSGAVAIVTDDMHPYPVKKIGIEDLYAEDAIEGFLPQWENEVIFCSSGTTGDVKLMVFNG